MPTRAWSPLPRSLPQADVHFLFRRRLQGEEVRPLDNWLLVIIFVTAGCPFVIVPVLSRTTTLTFPARSRASLVRNRMPASAPLPVPTITAVGVASPIAHGQAITSTATMLIRARGERRSSIDLELRTEEIPDRKCEQRQCQSRSAQTLRRPGLPVFGSAPYCPARLPPA